MYCTRLEANYCNCTVRTVQFNIFNITFTNNR